MASKEVMVSAPIIVLLYDRTFVAGTFRDALRARRGFYAALASTWLLLAWLIARSGGSRGGTAGFGADALVTPWTYGLTQCRAIVHYLRLCVCPRTLVFDYGTDVITRFADAAPFVAFVALLAIATLASLVSRAAAIPATEKHDHRARASGSPNIAFAPARAFGFLGCWFFATLAPTSSIVPIATEIAAEHRMYLPLAAVVVACVLVAHRMLGRARGAFPAIGVVAAAALGFFTAQRNADYRSELALWHDTVAKLPDNARAQFNFGKALEREGNVAGAVAAYERAARLKPAFASAHSNLANALLQSGRLVEARSHAVTALRLNPDLAEAHATLANILYTSGDVLAALPHYEEAVRLQPASATMRNNLGAALSRLDRLADALAHYEASARLDPANADTHFFLGNTLARLGRFADATREFEEALRLRPDFARARDNLERLHALAPNPAPKN